VLEQRPRVVVGSSLEGAAPRLQRLIVAKRFLLASAPRCGELRLAELAVPQLPCLTSPQTEAPDGRRISPRLRPRTPEKRVKPDPSAEGVGPTARAWIESVLATHAGFWPVQRVFPEYPTACSERSRAETLRPPGARRILRGCRACPIVGGRSLRNLTASRR